ncbi:unnamed protein product [Umbelopsis ramanniana]
MGCSHFGLLQSLKIVDLIQLYWTSHPENYGGSLFKWWCLNLLYLFTLWIVKIPWLQFSNTKTLVLALLVLLVNPILFALPSAVLSGTILQLLTGGVMGQQLAVSRGTTVRVKDVMHNSTHLLGRHTINILPYSTAKLNPDDQYYCIPSNEVGKREVMLPIILNNTIPRHVTLSRFDFDTKARTNVDYSQRDLRRATEVSQGQQGLEVYYIKVKKPGAYRLDSVSSKDQLDVRLQSSEAMVFTCPEATFTPISNDEYCQGMEQPLTMVVSGVPPLKVEYTRKVGTSASQHQIDNIQPDNYISPLRKQDHSSYSTEINPAMSSEDDMDWAASHHITLMFNLTLNTPTDYRYQINKVTDGTGNIIEYQEPVETKLTVHPPPSVKFECDTQRPAKLLIGSKTANLPLRLEGEAPWKIEYEYMNPESLELSQKTATLDSQVSTISVALSGDYKILSVQDRFCRGDVMYPSVCRVVQPPMPEVHLSATPIPSQCTDENEIGMKFVLEFQGTPPFHLGYTVSKQEGRKKTVVSSKFEKIDQSRYVFEYRPSTSGTYIYDFARLDDANYKERDTGIKAIKQVVHPQPSAKFSDRLTRQGLIRTCIGEGVDLDVELGGAGPYTLYWNVFNAGERHSFEEVATEGRHTITIPPLDIGGKYVVSLAKIQDANGCSKELDVADVTIEVRQDRPTASFYTTNGKDAHVTIIEGREARLPLRLTGERPWRVLFRNADKNPDKVYHAQLNDANDILVVREPGRYELVNIQDAYCPGDVSAAAINVAYLDKPTLTVDENQVTYKKHGVYERRPVCEGTDDAININLSGHSPFIVSYDIAHAVHGRRDYHVQSSETIHAGLGRTRIGLNTHKSGAWRYTFNRLSDEVYTQFAVPKAADNYPIAIDQTVLPRASAKFVTKGNHQRVICVGESLDSNEAGALPMEFSGRPPFSASIRVRHQGDPHGKMYHVQDIHSTKYDLSLPHELQAPGDYEVEIQSVSDDAGCQSIRLGPEAMVKITALDIATIIPIDPSMEHCVGDQLEFTLSGVGPFTINYQFNGKQEKIQSPFSRLSTIADKAGNFTIVSVGDQRNKCRSYPRDLTKIIYELPSTRVSAGKDTLENIREGDSGQAVVDLIGTPPFDFEWRRYELVWDSKHKRHSKGKVLESHMVHGIESHRYYISTSQAGTIEVVSVKDRHCQYPRSQ